MAFSEVFSNHQHKCKSMSPRLNAIELLMESNMRPFRFYSGPAADSFLAVPLQQRGSTGLSIHGPAPWWASVPLSPIVFVLHWRALDITRSTKWRHSSMVSEMNDPQLNLSTTVFTMICVSNHNMMLLSLIRCTAVSRVWGSVCGVQRNNSWNCGSDCQQAVGLWVWAPSDWESFKQAVKSNLLLISWMKGTLWRTGQVVRRRGKWHVVRLAGNTQL